MAYEPTVWKSGDVITSTKLNKLENGVADAGGGTGGGVLNLHMDRQTRALDKTWAEIDAAFGSTVIFIDATALLIGTEESVAGYFIYFADFYDAPDVAKITFKADTADGYPVAQIG